MRLVARARRSKFFQLTKKEKSMILAVILLFLSAVFGYAGSDLLAAIIGAASVCTALGSLVRDDLNKLD